jgi:hypothetical protein
MMQKHHKIKSITQQVPNEDIARKFLSAFVEIIYDEASAIPENMKISLQGFLNDLTNSAYLAKKELDDMQIKTLFSRLLEMNTLFLKLSNQVGNPAESLVIVQGILELLVMLESQKIYWNIVSPLLEILKVTEAHYIMEVKKPSSSLKDTEQKSTDNQTAEQLLIQINQAAKQNEVVKTSFEPLESTETSTKKVEEENTVPNFSS